MRLMGYVVVAALACGSASAATITGTINYDGKVPTLKPIDMNADAACAKMHGTPQPSDVLVLGAGNTMANILVSVTSGLPAGKTWPSAKDPVVMDQKGCRYEPHVFGLRVGQPFKVFEFHSDQLRVTSGVEGDFFFSRQLRRLLYNFRKP